MSNVLSLTNNGLKDWLIQRVTAAVLAAYVLFLLGVFVLSAPLTYSYWHSVFSCLGVRLFSVLALVSVCLHAWIGVWTVTTDYLKNTALRVGVNLVMILALLTYFVWGNVILWGV